MRSLFLLLVVIGLVLARPLRTPRSASSVSPTIPANSTITGTCGTCSSLGYQCVGAHPPKNNCGKAINPATCEIPSCGSYCLVMFSVSEGYCNDATHLCVCDTAVINTVNVPAPRTTATGSNCTASLCDRNPGWTCVPANHRDPCNGRLIPKTACPGWTACSTSCPCNRNGTGCQCGTAGASVTAATTVNTATTVTAGAGSTFALPVGGMIGVPLQIVVALAFTAALAVDYIQKLDMAVDSSNSLVDYAMKSRR